MPISYNPGITYNYAPLYSGISQAGGDIGQALIAYQQNKQQQAFNDSLFHYLATESGQGGSLPGAIDPETIAGYHDMNPRQKTGAILGALNNANMIRQQQQLQNQALLYGAHALMYAGLGRQTGAAAAGPAEQPQISPFTEPGTGRQVPGLATVWSPTTKQFQVVPYSTGGPMIQFDPQGVP